MHDCIATIIPIRICTRETCITCTSISLQIVLILHSQRQIFSHVFDVTIYSWAVHISRCIIANYINIFPFISYHLRIRKEQGMIQIKQWQSYHRCTWILWSHSYSDRWTHPNGRHRFLRSDTVYWRSRQCLYNIYMNALLEYTDVRNVCYNTIRRFCFFCQSVYMYTLLSGNVLLRSDAIIFD